MPDVYEMRVDPRALAEGRQTAQQLDPRHLAELVQATKREAEGATRNLRLKWQDWWDLWQNEVAFKDKEEWQSQIWVPKPFAAVEQAAAVIQRSLLDSPEFYGVSGNGERERLLAAHVWKPLLDRILDQADFVPKFADASKVGFITGVAGYLKYRWQSSQTPVLRGADVDPDTGRIIPAFTYKKRSMLAIDYVEPWKIFRDPNTRARQNFSGSYICHSEWLERPVAKAMVGRGWDLEACKRVWALNNSQTTGDNRMPESQQKDAERKQQSWERHKFRRAYLFDEWWGDVLDENGDVVFPNALMVHAHNEMVMMPIDNPIWATDLNTGRRKTPFLAGAPIVHPTRFEGRGILEQDEALSMLSANTVNLFADGMNWKVNPETEIYQPGLVDLNDLSSYPGKPWLKNVREQVLMAAQRGEIKVAEVLAFLHYIDELRQNVNFVTDFVVGLPGSRADITLGETRIKTNQSLGMFDGIARSLEHTGRDAVELAYDYALQFLGGNDYTDPSIASILGPEIAYFLGQQMPLEERVNAMQGNFKFTFTGVSQALQEAELLRKIMEFAALAGSAPYAGTTKPSQILRLVAEKIGVQDRIDIWEPAPMAMGPGMPGMPMGPGAPGQGVIQNPGATMRAISGPVGGSIE